MDYDELGAVREDSKTREKYDPRLRFLEVMPTSSQVVISCRVKEYHDIGAKMAVNGAVTLQPLDDLQLKQYLQNLPYLWDMLQEDDNLRQVARTPLLLSLFGYAFAGLAEEAKQLQYSVEGNYAIKSSKFMWREDISMKHVNRILGSVFRWKRSIRFLAQSACTNVPMVMCGEPGWIIGWKTREDLQFEALVEDTHSKGT